MMQRTCRKQPQQQQQHKADIHWYYKLPLVIAGAQLLCQVNFFTTDCCMLINNASSVNRAQAFVICEESTGNSQTSSNCALITQTTSLIYEFAICQL
jgi:hypothetical protein